MNIALLYSNLQQMKGAINLPDVAGLLEIIMQVLQLFYARKESQEKTTQLQSKWDLDIKSTSAADWIHWIVPITKMRSKSKVLRAGNPACGQV